MSLISKIKKNWKPILAITGAVAGATAIYLLRTKASVENRIKPIYPKNLIISYFNKTFEDISVIATSLAHTVRVRISSAGMDPNNPTDSFIELIRREYEQKDPKFARKLAHCKSLACNILQLDAFELERSIEFYLHGAEDPDIIRLSHREKDAVANAYRGVSPPLPPEAADTLAYLKSSTVIEIFSSILASNVHEMFRACEEIKGEIEKGEFDENKSGFLAHPLIRSILEDIAHVDEKPYIVEKLPDVRYAELAYHTKLNQICNSSQIVSSKIKELGGLSRMIGTNLANGLLVREGCQNLKEAFEKDIAELKALGKELDNSLAATGQDETIIEENF